MDHPSFTARGSSDDPAIAGRSIVNQRIVDQSTTLYSIDPQLELTKEIINAWRGLALCPGKQIGALTALILVVTMAEEVVVRWLLR